MNRASQRSGVTSVKVERVTDSLFASAVDDISVEEPLEIRLATAGVRPKPVSGTMRTPGDEAELAAGFLFTEGIISGRDEIESVDRMGANAVVAQHKGTNATEGRSTCLLSMSF